MSALDRFTNTKLELVCAIEAILWGFWVGNTIWDVSATSRTWSIMTKIAPEWLIGLIVFVLGLLQLISIIFNYYTFRQWLSIIAIFIWTTVSLAFIFSDYRATATAIYPIFVIISAIVYGEVLFQRRVSTI